MNESKDKITELQDKRRELIERLEAIEADYRRGLDPDAEEQAVQLENAEVLDGIARAAREELERIEKELARLKP
jgi:RNA polymerase-binding transcription factor DksA